MARKPRDAVFTTALWDGNTKVAHFDLHMKRLRNHADRLRINLPENSEQLIAQSVLDNMEKFSEKKLINITFDCISGEFQTKSRELPKLRNCNIDAMTIPMKKWLGQVTGTKHGDWQFYIDAKEVAEENGVDIALLSVTPSTVCLLSLMYATPSSSITTMAARSLSMIQYSSINRACLLYTSDAADEA